MDKWKFYQQPDGRWRWWHDDPHEGRSLGQSAFVSRNDCIANAMVHGYLAVSSATTASATSPKCASRWHCNVHRLHDLSLNAEHT